MSAFSKVGTLAPQRSVFDLSHDRKFDCDMGELVPILVEDCIPGDVFDLTNEVVVRFHQPLFAPLLHEVNVFVHYFFVPYRILWNDGKLWYGHKLASTTETGSWERYLSGDEQGSVTYTVPRLNINTFNAGSRLIDFLYGIDPTGLTIDAGVQRPISFPYVAYFRIWNEYYRNQTFQNEKNDSSGALLRRNWHRDYFTAALPWQQRGTAPALPITGFSSAVWDASDFSSAAFGQNYHGHQLVFDSGAASAVAKVNEQIGFDNFAAGNAQSAANARAFMNANQVDLSTGTTVDIAQFRLAFQLQKWLERNARAGVRYTEMLKSRFGVAPRDERLDRPEYIGGSKQPIIFSEVLKTSSDGTTPQGNLAGHGISVNRQHCARYRVQEFGVIMGLMSVMPKTAYQQGINRCWLRDSKYEHYWPEFAHLSEQPIWGQEIYMASSAEGNNRTVFGYIGRYDEYRYRGSSVHGSLRSELDYWHLGRQFSSRPALNSDFLECNPRKDIYPAPTKPGMLVNFGNIVRAARPMPIIADPGLIDHY